MAWVEKRPQGWVVRWRDAEGKHSTRAYGSKAAASAAAVEFEQRTAPKRRQRRHSARPVEQLTVAQIADLWRIANEGDASRMRRPGAAEYLTTAVAQVVRTCAGKGWLMPGDITPAAATSLRRANPKTVSILRGMLRWARDQHGVPFDPLVYAALRPAPSRRAERDLLTDRQARYVLARARRWKQMPLFSCLMAYGWRPVTACRLRVRDFNAKTGTVRTAVKHNGQPWEHPLFPEHVAMLRDLAADRPGDAPLFLTPRGKPWRISARGAAATLTVWYRRNIAPKRPGNVGNIYALKRLAISRMLTGAWPWPQSLSPADVCLFTGQRSAEVVVRYFVTQADRARKLVGNSGAQGALAPRMLPDTAGVPRGPA
ncbi:MAG: hypothetical protein H0W72_02960 [Planctomycetes bacterium]|nr:hypothetical protein [Planctomycetota bacterium]